MLLALSTGHKLGLGIAGGIFVLFAAVSAVLIPRYRPDFPGRRGLTPFIVLTVFVFLGMVFAVEVFGAEEEEKPEKAEEAETGTSPGPPSAGTPQAIKVNEVEFKIELPRKSYKPGSYVFDVRNAGQIGHDLTVKGPGSDNAKTPLIDPGKSAKLRLALQAGTYELYCSVPGHKDAGMDLKIAVS